jgi:hypothetical protein
MESNLKEPKAPRTTKWYNIQSQPTHTLKEALEETISDKLWMDTIVHTRASSLYLQSTTDSLRGLENLVIGQSKERPIAAGGRIKTELGRTEEGGRCALRASGHKMLAGA